WQEWYKTWKEFLEENNKRWEENEKRWQDWYETWKRFLEENNKRWEENERRWLEWYETWKKFLEDNSRRWEENERRWREWYETWRKFLEENSKRWEENEKRRLEWYKTWAEFQEDYRKRWDEANKKFQWLMSALEDIRDALGGGFEYYTARVVEALLKERGVECSVRVNVTLPVDGFKEVDIFCPQPLVVGEVSVAVRTAEEAEGLIEQLRRSVQAAEKLTGSKTYVKVLAVEFASQEAAERLKKLAEEEGALLILGREYPRPY
ncbi:SPOR domain-containing protein, partial [Pyrobaculum aerophilum]|uniref:SPOR domain-containing protein n=1 Tax=Pyrobaculum aerophilum TaxID=13773 RepID=UPI0023F43F34